MRAGKMCDVLATAARDLEHMAARRQMLIERAQDHISISRNRRGVPASIL
jgi:hypothetical protein